MLFKQLYKILFSFNFILLTFNIASAETIDQHIKVELRKIGHEFLLSLNDSTSRVLAIEKVNDRYAIRFEKKFSFDAELVVEATYKVLSRSTINYNYIVEIQKCEESAVVHSFKTQKEKKDEILACKGRILPLACYVFYYTPIQSKQIAYTKTKTNQSSFEYVYILIIFIIALGLVLYLIKLNKSKKSAASIIHIGQYQFDQKGLMLTLKSQSVELSSKEADLLYLLYKNENKVLEREYILNEVWGDVGDYVGRTLDVFVSKLRKKLSADAHLKIINVRGVGYKFVMN